MIKQIINSAKYRTTQSQSRLTPGIRLSYLAQALLLSFALTMIGCGSEVEDDPTSTDADTDTNTDITPTPEQQLAAFQENLYPVLTNRCGGCHATAGLSGIPDFASDTVLTAFNTINDKTLVDLNNAADSSLVTKLIPDLHQCNSMCQEWADEIRLGIEAWATAVNNIDGGGTDPTPDPVPDPDPIPDDQLSAFQANLYPVLTNRCGGCHASEGPSGTPDFAHETVSTAYNIVTANTMVNLGNPENSRLVTKLTLELHKCGSDCTAWADEIRLGIEAWSATVGGSSDGGINGSTITSSTLKLSDGIEGAGSGRVETDVVAKYEFKTGTGTTAFDTSGVAPALNLTFGGDVSWIPGQGISIADPNATGISKAVATQADSKKLYDMIAGPQGSQQYSVEAWIMNDNLDDAGPARIVSYSSTSRIRNFTMGQVTSYYSFRNRSNQTSSNGNPDLQSDNNAGDLKTELQHVVMTFDTTNGRNIFINGAKVNYDGVATDPNAPATIANDWTPDQTFIIGNEVPDGTDRQWKGKVFFVAIHNRALSTAEVLTNANAGIGTKISLEFDVSSLLDDSGSTSSKISLGVSELDAYSYVFAEPILTTDITTPNIRVKNIRIAVNGNVPAAAQAFRNVDMMVTSPTTELSRLGSVIPKDMGPNTDEFTLVFEILGDNQNIVVEPVPLPEIELSVNDPSPEHGLRTFEQINNTMSTLTGVDTGATSVTFIDLKQQLPSAPSLGSFVSAHQVGIAKLALEYCDALVESPALRTTFFGGTFEFNSAVSTAFSNQTKQNIITSNLVNKMVGTNLSSQPSLAEIQPDLDQLIGELTMGCNAPADCDAARTRTVVKAACAAVLASAAVTIQ